MVRSSIHMSLILPKARAVTSETLGKAIRACSKRSLVKGQTAYRSGAQRFRYHQWVFLRHPLPTIFGPLRARKSRALSRVQSPHFKNGLLVFGRAEYSELSDYSTLSIMSLCSKDRRNKGQSIESFEIITTGFWFDRYARLCLKRGLTLWRQSLARQQTRPSPRNWCMEFLLRDEKE